MSLGSIIPLSATAMALAGCRANDTERGLAGAVGGAVLAGAVGGSPVAGTAIGGAAGYFCRDLNVPGCINN